MKRLIQYFKNLFHDHDWHIEEVYKKETLLHPNIGMAMLGYVTKREGTKVYMRCKKCGEVRKHWKG